MKNPTAQATPAPRRAMNIRELAVRLRLSPGTVSRSLRHHPQIPETTRDRVIRAAAELGYTPRPWTPRQKPGGPAAPSVARAIGILVGDGYGLRPTSVEGSFLAHHFLAAIHPAAAAADVTTSTAFIDRADLPKLENPANFPPLLRGAKLDGLILIYPFPPAVVAELARRWPCVGVERHDTRGLVDAVGHGQTPATCESVSWLHALGHRAIGFVADIHAPGPRLPLNERFAGYLAGLDRHALAHDPARVIGMHGPTSTDEGLVAQVAACARAGTTAFVCALDRQAYLLGRDLPKHGIRVPADVSLVGYGGIDPLFGLEQATTWRVPYERIGTAVVDAVLRRADDPQSPVRSTEFPSDFIRGTTTAPPARQA